MRTKPTCLMTCGQCNCSTFTVCAMLMQTYNSNMAALDLGLLEEQKDKADVVMVSAAQAALLPAVAPTHDQIGFVPTVRM